MRAVLAKLTTSPIELHPLENHIYLVEGGGFEPPKAEPSDLQSDPFDRSGTPPLIYFFIGAGTRIRTRDLLITSQLLYQLSYASNI